MISPELAANAQFAVAKVYCNGSANLELLNEQDHGNFSGYVVVFASDDKAECENYINNHTVAANINTIVVAPGDSETVWQRQEDGLWQNMNAHSWAINYGSDEDEQYMNDYEMQREVDFNLSCGKHVEMW